MKRNGTIEVLRFVFSIMIMMLHFTKDNIWPYEKFNFAGGGISVEFFFLVSGWLFAKSLDKVRTTEHIGTETIRFMRRKIGGIYPEYIVAWLESFIVVHVASHLLIPSKIVRDFLEGLAELLLLRNAGLGSVRFIRGSWYISAMMLAMFVLFPIAVRNKERFFCIIAPLVFVFMTGINFTQFGKLRTLQGLALGFINSGLIRAFAEICLGCVCYQLSTKLASGNYSKKTRMLFSIIEMMCYLFTLLFIIYLDGHLKEEGVKLDFAVLLMLAAGVTISFSGISIWAEFLNNPLSYFLGKISFPLFLGHGAIILFLIAGPFHFEGLKNFGMFLLLALANACMIMFAGKLLRKHGITFIKKILF